MTTRSLCLSVCHESDRIVHLMSRYTHGDAAIPGAVHHMTLRRGTNSTGRQPAVLADSQQYGQAGRLTDRLTGRQTNRQPDRLTGRQADRQTDRLTDRYSYTVTRLPRDRPLLLALSVLALDRLRVDACCTDTRPRKSADPAPRAAAARHPGTESLNPERRALCSIEKRRNGSGSASCGI